ncbi:hypothetical protein TTHERM_00540040 (macronuclear) [Tetrahymena thermophila SB210]|uniref:AMP-binding enzyme family protein n=1 Tax=Tetrahymena thermophila (strain SB210) TaxID=312017 RepID=I7LU10_TETTS|nr:hypothetical protein TTHERM_00540040 [Tetrahymena thermophila SB210]EAR87684.2 hypothetical protein TTHERM_00540040 [Tetrahymena thermophila SB210]|eukprot:XP_001007929.2 hypothetical protein TTHERM_00540040 [Tetrahymena thermophila SB210]
MSVDQYQQSLNQTYLIYIVQLYYQDSKNNIYNTIYLNTFQCTTPELQGFICIDFSNVGNYTFLLDNTNNNQVYSSIYIHLYGCRDQDLVKTVVPDDCPDQIDIDNIIDGVQAYFQLKLKTQQYNTNSKEMQTNYRNLYNYVSSAQFVLNSLSTQKQETNVDSGLLFQQRQTYSSPIQYTQTTQNFDRISAQQSGLGPYSKQILLMDEIVQQFQIQYPTITEILAIINAVAGIIVVFRIVGKFYSQQLIKQDFFMLLLQNLYQDKYRKIINHNNLIKNQENISCLIQTEKTEKEEVVGEIQENCLKRDIIVPDFPTKLRDYVEKNQNRTLNNNNCQVVLNFNDDQINEENEKTENQKLNIDLINNLQNSEENFKIQNSANNNDQVYSVTSSPKADSINSKLIFSRIEKSQQNEQNEQDVIKNTQISENCCNNTEQSQLSSPLNKTKLKVLLNNQQISSQKQFLSNQKTQSQQKGASVFQSRSLFNTKQSNNISNSESIQQNFTQTQKKENLKEYAHQYLKNIKNYSFKQTIKSTIFKFKQFKSRAFFQQKGIEYDFIKQIEEEVNRNLNIYDVYKDIILLKKAIMMILSEEQLAAIQLVTLTEKFQSFDKTSNINVEQINNLGFNYFEKQNCILNSQLLQEGYLKKFYIKQQQEIYEQDAIDQRIFSSLLKY